MASVPNTDAAFLGSIPLIYERYLVPLIFEPYAADLARRLASWPIASLLELAAGTGVVTRELAVTLPARTSIVATDINQAMLDQAMARGTARPIEWRQADAMTLPFADEGFDAVVCEFGVMFLPDKPNAFAEARRVLKPGGLFLFNVWDRIEENEFADTATQAMASLFPDDPPRFLPRTPYGYYDHAVIERDLRAGGFTKPIRFETVAARSRAAGARIAAVALCEGTPLRAEIETRAPSRLSEATAVATEWIVQKFGPGPVDAKIQAHVIAAEK